MRNLTDYIVSYNNVLDNDFCEKLISHYESSNNLVESNHSWKHDYRSFTELNITKDENFEWARNKFYDVAKLMAKEYQQRCKVDFFPSEYGFEDARMKRYKNNEIDKFGWHTDVGDYASARRFLVMFFYLNTVEQGGETIFGFDENDYLRVKPVSGRIVMFPPMWMFPHIGLKPVSGPKYIISTYLHYT